MYLYLGHICFTAQNMQQESYDQLEWVHEPGSGQIHAIPQNHTYDATLIFIWVALDFAMYVTRESYDQLERGAGQVYGCNHMTSKKRAEAHHSFIFLGHIKKNHMFSRKMQKVNTHLWIGRHLSLLGSDFCIFYIFSQVCRCDLDDVVKIS